MISVFHHLGSAVSNLFFPQLCLGCGNDLSAGEEFICLTCSVQLPVTNFHMHAANPVEKIFWGRIPVTAAASLYYFSKNTVLQQLLHQFKYRSRKDLGVHLGRQMGETFIQSNRFINIDALIPLPLFPSKEKKRGFNQATVLCEGFSKASGIPCWPNAVRRTVATETQTKKNRIERWLNMEGKFHIPHVAELENKKILLVDDVVTTGATLEACGHELLKIKGLQLNIATLAYTSS